MHNKIIKYEHDVLSIGEGGFTQAHFDKLVKYNEKNSNKFFTVGYKRIKFNSYVGVIQAGNLPIEIYPKTDKSDNDIKWKQALLTMLHDCRYIKLDSLDNAFLRLKSASLVELFIESFINEVWQVVHEGMVKKYEHIENNIKYLKGRLILHKQLLNNIINKERFYTSHQKYNYNNLFNQILKAALNIITRLDISNHLKLNTKNLLYHFDEIEDKEIQIKTFENLSYDRKTERYRYAIQIAKLIILQYSPDITSGLEDILSILFDMNMLFEEYVCVNLKREALKSTNINYNIRSQENKEFWDGRNIRPDIVVRINGEIKSIIDTKWKILTDCKPSNEDLKQIYVYNLHFGSKKSLLVYPKSAIVTQEPKKYYKSIYTFENFEHSCQLYFVDLFDNEGKKLPFAQEILKTIEK